MSVLEKYMSGSRARARRGALLTQDWPATARMFDELAGRGLDEETLFGWIDDALKAHEAAFGMRDIERLMAVCEAVVNRIETDPVAREWADRRLTPSARRVALLRDILPPCYLWMVEAQA